MEALLEQCLTSLILADRESCGKMDVIIVNDGSTDHSFEIAHTYAEKYPEMFSVIDKENGNYGSCINAALPYVKGKYVRILDADDSYNTDELPGFLNVLEEHNIDLVLTDFQKIGSKGEVLETIGMPLPSNKELTMADLSADMFVEMHKVTYRSSIFKEIDYHQTEGVSYTDLEWVFHPMSRVKTLFYYNNVIYSYLVGREGQTIDAMTVLKRLSHMEKGLWTQLKVFKDISKSNLAYNYLISVVDYRVKLLYIYGLDRKAVFDLVAFDKRLKEEYPDIYERASSITLPMKFFNIHVPIVNMWRKVKSRKKMYLFPLYDLYVITNRLKICNK